MTRRLVTAAPYLLVLSFAARLAVTYLVPNGSNFIDLHVYVEGAAAIDRGDLYRFTYHPSAPPLPLRFTYPPFAALLFYPLHLMPFPLVGFCWQVGVAVALFWSVVVTLKLLGRYDARSAMLWTALGVWIEPARHLFELGQVGALLMLMVLVAVHSERRWLSGLLIGLAAGVKLTPAISGVYFLGVRRWAVAVWSAVVFLATVGVSILVLRGQGLYYFTDLLGSADRIGQVGLSTNQSLRGTVALVTGRDVGYGPVLVGLVVLAVVLAALAWRAVDAADRLGRILVVTTLGLLVSPVSWTHHWVWLLPLIMWLLYGSLRERTRVLGWIWILLAFAGTPWVVQALRESGEVTEVSWWVALVGSAYVLGALATLGYLAWLSRRSR